MSRIGDSFANSYEVLQDMDELSTSLQEQGEEHMTCQGEIITTSESSQDIDRFAPVTLREASTPVDDILEDDDMSIASTDTEMTSNRGETSYAMIPDNPAQQAVRKAIRSPENEEEVKDDNHDKVIEDVAAPPPTPRDTSGPLPTNTRVSTSVPSPSETNNPVPPDPLRISSALHRDGNREDLLLLPQHRYRTHLGNLTKKSN
jgi:hypothetical protein